MKHQPVYKCIVIDDEAEARFIMELKYLKCIVKPYTLNENLFFAVKKTYFYRK